mmetsp:Transcript_27480/g.68992  ORF Transcript_27480/g.68992 Transcript_27480/m.68992 type:complete len:439 (+) Transcript_27480:74-1390(+)
MADSKIIQYVQKFAWDSQTAETKHLTKRAILDLLGCALAGATHDTVPGVVKTIQEIDGPGCNCVWGTKVQLDVKGAIFMNAYTGALFDMDDGHRKAQGHPGAVLVPAALTVGARLGSSGKEVLEAVAVGYDVAVREAVRIREAGGPRKGSSGWCAPGAAASVGRLLKLTDEQMANAIGLAEYFTPQAGQDRSVDFPSMMKEGIPWGAYTGSFCAHLAKGGFTAHRPHLADTEDLCKDLGERIEVDFAYYKKWAACRWAHPALSGLDAIKAEKGFGIGDVTKVELRSFQKGLKLSNVAPKNSLEAVYSIPFSLAYWMKHGKIEPDDLKDPVAMVSDPQINDMATRIEMSEATEYTAEFPLRCIQDVTVTFTDGSTATKAQLEAPGDPGERAFTDKEIETKFQTLAEPVVGAKWKAIVDTVGRLDELPDIKSLIELMSIF